METFEINEEKDGYSVLTCPERKLEMMVIERQDIPEVLPEHQIVWGVLKNKTGHHTSFDEIIVAFCMLSEYEEIEYEPLLRPMLIADAMAFYAFNVWGRDFDRVQYSEGFKGKFLTPLLDKSKWTKEVHDYMRDLAPYLKAESYKSNMFYPRQLLN